MNGTVLRKEFAQSLNTASRFIAHRAQLPILSNVLLRADKAKLNIYATNLEMSIAISVGAKINEPGEIAVPARTLTDLVNNLLGENIDFSVDQETLNLHSSSFSGTVSAMNTSDFPQVPQAIEQKNVTFESEMLLEAISQVIYSVSTDETRPVLSGVLFKLENGQLTLVASDGYRLSKKNLSMSIKGDDFSVIIPRAILSELGRITTRGKIEFELRKVDNQVVFSLDNAVISSRTIEGEYPPFETVIQKPTSITVSVDKNELQQAVKVSAVYAREGGNAVKFKVNESSITLSAQSATVGSQETTVDAKVDGGETEVSLNYKFVEDALNVIEKDNVEMQLQDSSSPVKFRGERTEDLLNLIMPLKS